MTPGIDAQIFNLIISLIAVIAAIFAFAFVYKKFGRTSFNHNKHLKVLATMPLGTKEKLLIVQVGDEQLLLGATNHNIVTLHHLTKPITIDKTNNLKNKKIFNQILAGLKK